MAEEISLVEQWLRTNLIDDNPFITELLPRIFEAGGKRIRPTLVLLCSRASLKNGLEFSRLHIILAVLTELIHTASLIHDDVVDNASLRRGQETVNRSFNDRVAVLMGDLLFAQASICLAQIMNPEIVGIYGRVLGDLCAGELSQMQDQFVTVVNWAKYISKSIAKTASLFAAGSHSAAILNAASNETVVALKSYGLKLGICFQIVDDLLDVIGTSDKLGKQPGSDLKGGVITAPALFVLERQDANQARLVELIRTKAICHSDGVKEAIKLIVDSGGVEATMEMGRRFACEARECLVVLSPSMYKDALAQMVDYVLNRISCG